MLYRHWLRLFWVAAGTVLVINAGIRPVAAGHGSRGSAPSAVTHADPRSR